METCMLLDAFTNFRKATATVTFLIIIINIQSWAIWPVPSPELQLLSPSLLRSPNCSLSLWAVEVRFVIRLNKTPTWCNKMQNFYYCRLSLHVSGTMRPSSRVQNTDTAATGTGSYGCRWILRFIPNMAKWGSTCNHNYLYRWLPCQYFILLMMGAWRPKHVEKVCAVIKFASCCITSVFYLTLYYDARKHKIKMCKAIALPPLFAYSDTLWGDLYLQEHSLISKRGQNMKIRLLQEDKKSPRGMKWLTTCARTWWTADLPRQERRRTFSKAVHVKRHTTLTDRFVYTSRRFAI